jgi:hypothetical protein
MSTLSYRTLCAFEGQIAVLRTTEGERIRATVVHVDREHEDVVLDVLETDSPERYARMGRAIGDTSWVIPFEFIGEIRRG